MSNEHHLSILELSGLPLNSSHIQLLAKVNIYIYICISNTQLIIFKMLIFFLFYLFD